MCHRAPHYDCYQSSNLVNLFVISNVLQRIRIARNADRCNSQSDSVRPSARLSVSHIVTCFVHKNEDTILRFSTSGRTIILVYGVLKFVRKFAVIAPSEGVKVENPLSLAKI